VNIEIPKIGMTFSRLLMPQIKDRKSFLKTLDNQNIKYDNIIVNPEGMKATQSEFDLDKVRLMMSEPLREDSGIIISNDNYILDGHHRWIVYFNLKRKMKVIKVDLPILELMRIAKEQKNIDYKPVVECVINVIKSSLATRKYK